jgi:hypothetical protein
MTDLLFTIKLHVSASDSEEDIKEQVSWALNDCCTSLESNLKDREIMYRYEVLVL